MLTCALSPVGLNVVVRVSTEASRWDTCEAIS